MIAMFFGYLDHDCSLDAAFSVSYVSLHAASETNERRLITEGGCLGSAAGAYVAGRKAGITTGVATPVKNCRMVRREHHGKGTER